VKAVLVDMYHRRTRLSPASIARREGDEKVPMQVYEYLPAERL
jgi:hypothetical protein